MDYLDTCYAIALSVMASPGENAIWSLVDGESPSRAYEILRQRTSVRTQACYTSHYSQNPITAAEQIYSGCVKKSITVITRWDDGYPHALKNSDRPPIVLYVRGRLFDERKIAIVGTRNADSRASGIARRLSAELSLAGFTIVSGMAVGIDREAHIGALHAGGKTAGVLANGIDIMYPAANRDLYAAIEKSEDSALISEYPPGVIAGKWTFVRRNRIISGLSDGTVVVKAGEKSGALITARYAVEQNRDVFVCPGNTFDAEYFGCNRLIRQGAVPVSQTEDILRELLPPSEAATRAAGIMKKDIPAKDLPKAGGSTHMPAAVRATFDDSSIEGRIMKLLDNSGMDMDEIVRSIGMPPASVLEALMTLELERCISRRGNIVEKA